MRAIVKPEAGPGLVITDVAEPEIGINDVLIRVERTGICGTDLHIDEWNEWAQQTVPVPLVIGHEFVGEIVEVGSNVSDFTAGDVVSGEGHVVCGRCRNCMAGRRHLCADAKGIGVNRPGAFAELIALPMTNVWHHDPAIDRDVAAIFDPFGNAVVRHAGARHVVITDVNPYRLELARWLGVSVALDVRETSIVETQAKLGMKEGFDVGLEMSGNPAALHDMLENMAHGGRIAMLGLPDEPFAIDWNTVIFDQLTIRGVYGRQMYETWYMMTVMLQSGLDISPVITHRFPADRFEEAFAAIRTGETGKVLLDWSEAA
jgi:threonine 3-dehydrogenase